MLGESGLCLARDGLSGQGGVRTPMSALGAPLALRLRKCGFTVETTQLSR
jgi:short subunit dehydrogenase-like uncharacterized protein